MRLVLCGCLAAVVLQAQTPDGLNEYLEALGRTAATFAATAPGLMATETLDQRGRPVFFDILQGRKDQVKKFDVRMPPGFREHHVVSGYTLAAFGKDGALHENRVVRLMDGKEIPARDEAPHAMTIGLASADDVAKRILLENLDREQLEGAATDFGLVMLLFQTHFQKDYEFAKGGGRTLGDEPVDVITYRQISGSQGLTFFRDRTESRQPSSGEIWFLADDLLPVRITLNTREALSKKYTIRTEATVDYTPSPFGLVPASVVHRQFLKGGAANDDLMMENDFHYADFHHASLRLP